MPSIKLNLIIKASSDKVYESLTEQEHLKLWWTPDCKAEPKEGTEARFEFNPYGDYIVFDVEKLVTSKEVVWKVKDSKMMGTDEWEGTTVIFELKEENGDTDVKFVHMDWKSESECFKKCTDGWKHFINSLKSYLESGIGKPFVPK